jgi:hypothetical protein
VGQEDGWLPGPQGNDLGEDALELRAKGLCGRRCAGRVELRPVESAASIVTRVVGIVKGVIVVADADDDDVGIAERLDSRGVRFQLCQQTVGLQPVVLERFVTLTEGRFFAEGRGIAVGIAGAAGAVSGLLYGIDPTYQAPGGIVSVGGLALPSAGWQFLSVGWQFLSG